MRTLAPNLALLSVLACLGCEPRPPVFNPAEMVIERYPPLSGELASMMKSGEVTRQVENGLATERQYTDGRPPYERRVSEFSLHNEVVQVITRQLLPCNPIRGLKVRNIMRISYGNGPGDGLIMTSEEEIHAVVGALERHSSQEEMCVAWRPCGTAYGSGFLRAVVITSRIDSLRSMMSWDPPSEQGLFLEGGEKEPIAIMAELTGGRFVRIGDENLCFFNNELGALIRQTAAKHDVKLKEEATAQPARGGGLSEQEAVEKARKSLRGTAIPSDCVVEVSRANGRYTISFVRRITTPFPARLTEAAVIVNAYTGTVIKDPSDQWSDRPPRF